MKYKIHSRGKNWWHLRSNLRSCMESFTITIIHDGTIVMTGDYGVLALQRDYYPENIESLIGWPNINTNIEYFAEKVCQYGGSKKITDWDETRAREEINEHLVDYYKKSKKEAHDIVDNMYFETPEKMYDALRYYDNDGDWWECEFGIDYTHHLKFQLELFKKWTEAVLKDEKN